MLLTVSKRLEFSASRRLFVKDSSDAENLAAFGPETKARYGTGRNYCRLWRRHRRRRRADLRDHTTRVDIAWNLTVDDDESVGVRDE